jgi:hypothetical protein
MAFSILGLEAAVSGSDHLFLIFRTQGPPNGHAEINTSELARISRETCSHQRAALVRTDNPGANGTINREPSTVGGRMAIALLHGQAILPKSRKMRERFASFPPIAPQPFCFTRSGARRRIKAKFALQIKLIVRDLWPFPSRDAAIKDEPVKRERPRSR